MIAYVEFKGHNFQQIILIPMEANILPLIGDRLYSYGTDVYKNVSKKSQLQMQKFKSHIRMMLILFCQLII